MHHLKTYLKNTGAKRILVMTLGNIILGLGVALFKLSALGNDPFDGMNMALAQVIGISYPLTQILVNIGFFVIEILFGRHYIGFGTVVNAFFLGYFVSFFYAVFGLTIGYEWNLGFRIFWVLVGVVITCLGLSLYQRSDVGVAPYDALALIMHGKWQKFPYFWARILCDACCALVCFLAGGIVGAGTLISAFGLGPVVSFWDRIFTDRFIYPRNTRQ